MIIYLFNFFSSLSIAFVCWLRWLLGIAMRRQIEGVHTAIVYPTVDTQKYVHICHILWYYLRSYCVYTINTFHVIYLHAYKILFEFLGFRRPETDLQCAIFYGNTISQAEFPWDGKVMRRRRTCLPPYNIHL